MTTTDDFEHALRQGLATLAREAVPDASASPSTLPPMQSVGARRRRRFGPRLLAAGVTIAVATASVVVALSVRDGSHTSPVQPSSQWKKIAPFPLEPRSSQVAVFTGHDVIVWGGRSDSAGAVAIPGGQGATRFALDDGAVYDVGTDRWRVLPRAPIAGHYDAVAAWTGTEMLVVGGRNDGGAANDGAAYDPARNRWRRMPDAPGCPQFGVWTGTEMIVGGSCGGGKLGARVVFAAYDPAHNRWSALPAFASATQLVAVGGDVYAWSSASGRGAVHHPGERRWRALPPIPDTVIEDSVAIAYRDRLVVVGREADPRGYGPDLALAAILGAKGRAWTWEASVVGPPLGDAVVAAAAGAVVWESGVSLSAETIDRPMRSFALMNVAGAPISLARSGESIVAIGYRRFLVWGGRLAGTEQDPTNRPTADGAIVQLP